jgi:hypothetical protein
MKKAITQLLKYEIVEDIRDDMFVVGSNTYIAIGRPIRWGTDNNETASEVEDVTFSTNYRNQIYRDMVAMKKVQTADMVLVVPRVDWETGTTYDYYVDHLDMFTHESRALLGNVDATSGSTSVEEAETDLFDSGIVVGDIVEIGGVDVREVIALNTSTGILTVNSAVTQTYSNADIVVLGNTYPNYANTFYVRNSKDQVFKCMDNDDAAVSTVEPTIDIDGQLPENPYIKTGDGYKWKYLYTIPYGLKRKFFTSKWMPVVSDDQVTAGSEDGRIDIIQITDGGTGYYLDGQSGNSNSLSIVTVTGDGTGASVTAKVESGVITDLNIIDGGGNYTNAVVTITDNDQLAGGNTATFDVVISPPGGHGSNPAKELGCFALMVTTELSGTENDKIPVGTVGLSQDFDFRQISILRDPKTANGLYANASVYRACHRLGVTDPGITNFVADETITSANLTATVVSWNPNTNELDINNVNGTLAAVSQITGQSSGAVSTIISITEPEITLFSGDVLYVENRQKITRDVDQTEQIKIVLAF